MNREESISRDSSRFHTNQMRTYFKKRMKILFETYETEILNKSKMTHQNLQIIGLMLLGNTKFLNGPT